MVRLRFGPQGEFFIERCEELTGAEVEVAENLYKRIMNARSELDILNDARRAMGGDGL